ncbi:MAG: DNA-binding protein [Chloroflexota bacterium]|nr:MAG: DNA-binding protein [Chloroflexota bacterium]
MATQIRADDPSYASDRDDTSYSVAEAAAKLDVHPVTIWRWIDSGELPATRIGARKIRIRATDVRAMCRDARHRLSTSQAPRPDAAEIARRQALLREILESRKHRVISPLTSVDLIRMARLGAAGVDDAG